MQYTAKDIEARKRKLLERLTSEGSIKGALLSADITAPTLKAWRDSDAEFERRWSKGIAGLANRRRFWGSRGRWL